MKIPQFKIRASAVNRIMAKPTGKKIISTGAETYVKEWYAEQVYDRRNTFSSKYTEKGNLVEDESLKFISTYLQLVNPLEKNQDFYENLFMTGTPDAMIDRGKDTSCIVEVKNSWNCFTFPLTDKEVSNKGYFYQCQAYMHLTGIKYAKLIYTLMNTPKELIEDEYMKTDMSTDFSQFRKDYEFTDIPFSSRIKIFNIEYDEDVIKEIAQRVEACREYIYTQINNTYTNKK